MCHMANVKNLQKLMFFVNVFLNVFWGSGASILKPCLSCWGIFLVILAPSRGFLGQVGVKLGVLEPAWLQSGKHNLSKMEPGWFPKAFNAQTAKTFKMHTLAHEAQIVVRFQGPESSHTCTKKQMTNYTFHCWWIFVPSCGASWKAKSRKFVSRR